MDTHFALREPLRALGEHLSDRGQHAAVVIVGGTALNLLGVVHRPTRDVDVIAVGEPTTAGPPSAIAPPNPLPPFLEDAVARVARDFDLPTDWFNVAVGEQWKTGLPPGFEGRIKWHPFGGLWVGLPGRTDLLFLKLYATADDVGPASRHFTDLVALHPTREELREAAGWITGTQDPSPAMRDVVQKVIQHVILRSR